MSSGYAVQLKNAVRALLLSLPLLAAASVGAAETYTFAVVPQFEQRKLFRIWKPVVEEVTRRSGVQLKLVATLTVAEFERELSDGAFDFNYANPYHIMRESRRQGYVPLVRDSQPLTGLVVVARDSPLRSLADLDGKTLAVPSPNALGASLLLRADLELNRVRVAVVDVKTHSSVYLNVANRLVDAGGGVHKTFAEQDQSIRDGLRVLYTTRGMPSHPVSAHPRVAASVREAVRRAFLEMAATPAGRALLEDVQMPNAVATSIDEYLVMQDWGLEKYWVER